MNKTAELLTPQQKAACIEHIENDGPWASSLIIDNVLAKMDPPPGVEREYGTDGRLHGYAGYLPSALASVLIDELPLEVK